MSHSTTGIGRRASWPPPLPARMGWTARLALTVLACTFAGAGQAQIIGYETLDVAVHAVIKKLVEDMKEKGHPVRKVFVGADDFFEEETGLRLPLADELRRKCRTALTQNGVGVPVSESEAAWVLHGRWRRHEESLQLTLFIAEPVEEGDPDVRASGETFVPVKTIRPEAITSTLDHWGPELVRQLEGSAHDHRKRAVRLRPIAVEGDVGQPDRLGQHLATWLKVAFGETRRNRLYTLVEPPPDIDPASVKTDGTLRAKAAVHAEAVVVSLTAYDDGWRQVASARITVSKGLFPPDMVDPGPRRFRAKVRAVVSEGLDREGATRAMRNLARARVVAQALGLPPPSIDVVRTEADGVRALTGTLGHGIPVDERFSGPRPDGAGGLEAELDVRVVEVGATARPRVEASLDKNEFLAQEPIWITLSAEAAAHAAVFAWGADNRVVRLYPNPKAPDLVLEAGSRVTLPRAGDGYIWSAPMPGNAEDHEAFLVLAAGGPLALDGLAGQAGGSPEETIQAAVSGAGFFDALAGLDTSRLALIVLPYRVTAR